MRNQKTCLAVAAILALIWSMPALSQSGGGRLFNTAKAKLLAGGRIVGGTVTSSDPSIYCAMANAGYDFLWIEMQHSPLNFQDVARMIWACRDAPAMPFMRISEVSSGQIQRAVDSGVVGIFIPLVDTVEEVEAAIRFAKYPPIGERSLGGGQYRALWGDDYRAIANDNVMIIPMIESPLGVSVARQVAKLPGVDGLFAASTDLGSFSGYRQGDPEYEALVDEIVDAGQDAGIWLAGPQAWMDRPAFSIFQAPSDTALLTLGIRTSLENVPTGVAPTEGEDD